MNRDEAVARFEVEGFHAFKRDWSFGATVGAGIVKGETEGIQEYSKLIYLFPTKNGWGIDAPTILLRTDYSQCLSLESACDLAIKILRCDYLPIKPDEIHFSVVRARLGDGQEVEHLPTGIKRSSRTQLIQEVLLRSRRLRLSKS